MTLSSCAETDKTHLHLTLGVSAHDLEDDVLANAGVFEYRDKAAPANVPTMVTDARHVPPLVTPDARRRRR